MKMALSFAGYFNSQRDAASLGADAFRYVFDTFLSKYDVDIYIHSWDIDNQGLIESLYGKWIKRSVFEKQIDFQPVCDANGLGAYPLRDGVTKFCNVFSQLYSVQESMKLVEDRGYDVVVKSRFDIGRINIATLNRRFPVQFIKFDPKLDMNFFYMAEWPQHTLDYEGPADVWFYSSHENMKGLCGIYDTARKDIFYGSEYSDWCGPNDGGPLNTAKAWKWVLIKAGLWDKQKLLVADDF